MAFPEPAPSTPAFDFSGGELCLDFVNTVSDHGTGRGDLLTAWPDLVAWGQQAGLVPAAEAARLLARARRRPQQAAREFRRALGLRQCLYRVFSHVAAGHTPPAADLETLNAWIGRVMRHARVVATGQRLAWGWAWADGRSPFDRILWPVVRSAADRLASASAADVRECASATCTWLFVDRSRTKKRRWCSMQGCGNRAKVRRFYARRRAHAGG